MRTKNKFLTQKMKPLAAVLATTLFAVPFAYGLAIEEDFTKGQTKNKWLMPDASGGVSSDSSRSATNKACLTATTAGAKTASLWQVLRVNVMYMTLMVKEHCV